MNAETMTATQEWKRHWTLASTACIGFAFMAFMSPSIGIFMGPLGNEFGWTRTQLSSGISIAALVTIALVPFVGAMVDRWGVRRLALPGIVATAGVIASFSLMTGSIYQWMGLWLLWGLTSIFVQFVVWATAVAAVFVKSRGLALAVALAGTALAQVVTAPLANWLIGEFGWRATYMILGFGWGGLAFVLSYFFLLDPPSRTPRVGAAAAATTASAEAAAGLTVAEAWRSSELWRVFIATFLTLTVTIAIGVHMFPILMEAGATRAQAAWMASLSGLSGIAGKLVTGTLVDRFHVRWIGGLTLGATVIAYPLLMRGHGLLPLAALGIAISGYTAGTKVQLCSYLTARYAGMRNYGKIFGSISTGIYLAGAIGPVTAGIAYDMAGSYVPLLAFGVLVSIISSGLVFSLGPYPDWKARAASGSGEEPIAPRAG